MKKLLVIILSNLLAASAFAEGSIGSTTGSGLTSILMIVGIFVVGYFLLLRPQMKQQKQTKKMLADIAKGDEIVTTGGIVAKVIKLGDNYIEIAISDSVEIKIKRQAVAAVLPKGSMKTN